MSFLTDADLPAHPEGAGRRWTVPVASCLAVIAIGLVGGAHLELRDVLDWVWQRHHNPLSWYIRPLFLIPFALFAYRRSWAGMGLTLIALATSMAWFPAPEHVDPRVADFLAAEKEWILGDWTLAKIALSSLAPLSFVLLGAAFWHRAWWLGVLLMALFALAKVLWSFWVGEDSASAVVLPAVLGLMLCVAVVMVAAQRSRTVGRQRPRFLPKDLA